MSSNNIPLKLSRGYKDNLPTTIEDGIIYYCIDSNELFFDYVNNSTTPPTKHRYCLNPMVGDTDYGDPVGKGLVSTEDKEIIDTAVRFVEQHLGPEQQKQARLNIDAIGEKTLEGGEIFNNYNNNIATGNYSHAEGSYTKAMGDSSHAEGRGTTASGENSHAEGYVTKASGYASHAEGDTTKAIGVCSHAEGERTQALGDGSHAEGVETVADSQASHAEGFVSVASAIGAHAEGYYSEAAGLGSHAEGSGTASGYTSHAEGQGTIASGDYQHVQGKFNIEDTEEKYAHIVGNGESDDARFNAHTLDWEGNAWFAGDIYVGSTSGINKDEGSIKLATINDIVQSDWNQNDPEALDYVKNRTHWSESTFTTLIEEQSVTTVANDEFAFAQISSPLYLTLDKTYEVVFNGITYECVASYAVDWNTIFIGNSSILGSTGGNGEPFCIDVYNNGQAYLNTVDAGTYTISISSNIEEIHKIDGKYLDLNIVSGYSEGSLRTKYSANTNYGYVMGEYAFAEGSSTQATGFASHAEGTSTEASGNYSHTEGIWTHAKNEAAHAEGRNTFANGLYSHAEGRDTTAAGNYSHAEGLGTQALSGVQHVQGRWNIPDSEDKYLHIVGNGSAQYAHSNAHTLDWEGNAWFAGNIRIGGTSYETGEEPGAKPYMTKVILTPSDWDATTLTQVTTIQGIKADETAQAIYINPIFNDAIIDEIGNCNVYASAQGENSITFSCDSVPTIDVEFYVKWQDITWIEPATQDQA